MENSRSTLTNNRTFLRYLSKVDFAIIAIPNTANEELELLFIRSWRHDDWSFRD